MVSEERNLTGEENLDVLLGSLAPQLLEDEFVFCTLADSTYGDHAAARPLASFLEAEGLTLVVRKRAAESLGFTHTGGFRCISLGVQSSLKAVGLTAAVTGKLSEHGISANVMAAYFHDHVFVPAGHAQQALQILVELSCRQ